MGFFDKLLKTGLSVAGAIVEEGMKKQGQMQKDAERKYNQQARSNPQSSNGTPKPNPFAIGGKTVDEWERTWQSIGTLGSLNLTPYNKSVGVYRAWLNGKIIYIGRAIEWDNGGFRKRLSDYTRDSDSARHHGSGQKMYENRDRLQIDIIITGSDADSAKVASQLELRLIAKYTPEWNVKIKF